MDLMMPRRYLATVNNYLLGTGLDTLLLWRWLRLPN